MVRLELVADYYSGFTCTGSACVYHCCQNWEIDLSKADYTKIRAAKKKKDLENLLKIGMKRKKDSTDERYAYFETSENVCAMLRTDGLCELQMQCGANILPTVCRLFPRCHVQAGEVTLSACSAGCYEVMKALVLRKQMLSFVSEETTGVDKLPKNVVIENKKHPVARHIIKVLEVCVDILQNRVAPLTERMVLLGMALRALEGVELNEQANGPQEQAFAQWHAQYKAMGHDRIGMDILKKEKAVLSNVFLTEKLQAEEFDQDASALLDRLMRDLGADVQKDADAEEEGKKEKCINYNAHSYQKACDTLYAALDVDVAFENILINHILTAGFPFGGDSIWQDYLFFCQMYSYLRFTATLCFAEHGDMEKLFRDMSVCYRMFAHSKSARKALSESLQSNDCSTLAHMAVLLSI